jgi:hypothetical protein
MGIILIVTGLIVTMFDGIPLLGRLPGDISFEKKNFKFYFPVTTSIVVSILISIILYIIQAVKK